MKEIQNNQEIPIPEGLEERLSALVDRLEAEEKEAQRRQCRRIERQRWAAGLAIAAAFVAVAFLLIVPQMRERREMARYEGSYTVVDGQRIDDLHRIKGDISEALAVAQVAEANVPAVDFASEAERTILQATDDPEMRAIVQHILQ